MGNVAFAVSQKIYHLTPTPLYCIRSWGHPLPTCATVAGDGRINGEHSVLAVSSGSYMQLEIKINGETTFGRFCYIQCLKHPTLIALVCGGLTLLFLEKNPDLFPQPQFCSCKVRIHATEILQLKLMGNVAFVCISKNIPLNPYPVILYKIVGSPPPHLCKKIRVRHRGRIGRRWHQVAIHAAGNLPTKINGEHSFWPFLCN